MGVSKPYRFSADSSNDDDPDDDDDIIEEEAEGELLDLALAGDGDGEPAETSTEGETPTEGQESIDPADGDDPEEIELPPADELGDDVESIALDGVDADDTATESVDDVPASDLDSSKVGTLVTALADHDIRLPDDTDSSNLLDRLLTALIATSEDYGGGDEAEFEISQPQQGIVNMSADTSVAQYASRSYKRDLATQLNKLLKSGRATPAEIRTQVDKLKTVRLSLDQKGQPLSNEVSAFVENRKTLPEGAVWSSKERLRRMSASPQPAHATTRNGELTGEALDKEVDNFFKR